MHELCLERDGLSEKGKIWVSWTVKKFEKSLATPFANEENYIKMSTDKKSEQAGDELKMEPTYHRVLLKISGEALAGDASRGLDFSVIGQVCDVIKRCVDIGVQVGVVVGGGNFWRGVKDGGGRMERTRADHMGMLATSINALAVADMLEQKGVDVRVQTAIEMRAIAEPYIRSKAIRHLEKGRVVIFGCGTGNPFFSTDTAAVLRAAEINADVILLAKNIDGVYSADPHVDPSAVKYDSITYGDVLAQRLQVMDSTATSLSMDNKIPVLLFALKDPENILRAVMGEKIGTIVRD
jgi:uridylate kinase